MGWQARDLDLEAHVAALGTARRRDAAAFAPSFVTKADWRDPAGNPMTPGLWENAETEGFAVTLPCGTEIRVDRRGRRVTVKGPSGPLH